MDKHTFNWVYIIAVIVWEAIILTALIDIAGESYPGFVALGILLPAFVYAVLIVAVDWIARAFRD
jgi:hypothetical protein